MLLEDFFSEEQIIGVLCDLRIAASKKRHGKHLLYNISKDSKNKPRSIQDLEDNGNEDIKKLYLMLPPRRLWHSHRKKRKERSNKSGIEIDRNALLTAVAKRRKFPKKLDETWLTNLSEFIKEVRERVFGETTYSMKTPKIIPISKESKDRTEKTYRPIAKYGDLVDQVVNKLCAKYLRELFDSTFLDCSYAFRTKHEGNHVPDRHDAIKKLIAFRKAHLNEPLWVAECDIQKFFDCVHHDEARKALDRAIDRSHKEIDPHARAIFEAYLSSYSFPAITIPQVTTYLENKHLKGQVAWCEEELKNFYSDPFEEKIGIPQGGAISCLIVNLILDAADHAVFQDSQNIDPDLLYLRYCDDIIIVHTNRDKCNAALDRYIKALESLKLVPYKPVTIEIYNKSFYDKKKKSKFAYKWDRPDRFSIPWVGFLGYQISHDGLLRVRLDSINKELRKQAKVVNEILRAGCPHNDTQDLKKVRRSKHQILHSLHQKLISMSVGRIKLTAKNHELQGYCWCSGFELLKKYGSQVAYSQLRRLDRGREKQVSYAKNKLQELNLPVNTKPPKHEVLSYYGNPFSYHAQFFL